MNNLLRTLTESRVKPTGDLKLLLTAVKETRRQSYDAKLSDAFYDSLDNLLADLRTISIDNRDAEAFLKPVSRAEVPDYYDYITNPMDFATMARKLKNKQYKSKREFKDDLDLIWSNCYKYNAAEDHPLRQCADRLKAKAERLLKYITDRKDRTDPQIPHDLVPQTHASTSSSSSSLHSSTVGIARPKVNGAITPSTSVNGHRRGVSSASSSHHGPVASTSSSTLGARQKVGTAGRKKKKADVPFEDTPALVRTAEGMAAFRALELGLLRGDTRAVEDLKAIVRQQEPEARFRIGEDEDEADADGEVDEDEDEDDLAAALGAVAGDKRKAGEHARKRKRARFAADVEEESVSEMWWNAVLGEGMAANGLPDIPYASSAPSTSTVGPGKAKKKRRAKAKAVEDDQPQPKRLLTLMNNNIKTLRRVRQTHAKIAALAAASAPVNLDEDGNPIEGAPPAGPSLSMGSTAGLAPAPPAVDEADVGDEMDERHWMEKMTEATSGTSSTSRRGQPGRGVEFGAENAHSCMRWVGEKILEHSGFQGASSSALEVLTGVVEEYIGNVGRSVRFLEDKYGGSMSPEEIILHTLFESGISKVQDLEKFIKDDVERHGTRLLELEKKLVGAYRESTASNELLEDEGLFESEDEDETPALAVGDFADALNEDYLGLRELGIAAEFGLSNLSIPKSLLKRKKNLSRAGPGASGAPGAGAGAGAGAVPGRKEKKLDYPLPPPVGKFVYGDVGGVIGLLKGYYEKRFEAQAARVLGPGAAPVAQPLRFGMAQVQTGYLPVLPGPNLGMSRLPGPVIGGAAPAPGQPATTMYPPNPYPTPTGTQSQTSSQSQQSQTQSSTGLPMMPNTSGKQPAGLTTAPSSQLTSGMPGGGHVPSVLLGSTSPLPTPGPSQLPQLPLPPTLFQIPADLELPDDAPNYLQCKMGPLGQIATKSGGGGGGGSKKKSSGGGGGAIKATASSGGGKPGDEGAVHSGGYTVTMTPMPSMVAHPPPQVGATFIPTIVGPNGLAVGKGGSAGAAGSGKGTGAGPGRPRKVVPGIVSAANSAGSGV